MHYFILDTHTKCISLKFFNARLFCIWSHNINTLIITRIVLYHFFHIFLWCVRHLRHFPDVLSTQISIRLSFIKETSSISFFFSLMHNMKLEQVELFKVFIYRLKHCSDSQRQKKMGLEFPLMAVLITARAYSVSYKTIINSTTANHFLKPVLSNQYYVS